MELRPGYKQSDVGVIPKDWCVVSLGSLATAIASGKSSTGATNGTYPVHGSTGIIGHCENPEYEGDAILAARVGANAGRLNLVSGKYGVTDNTILLRLNSNCCLSFFWHQLETKQLNKMIFGSGQPLITGTQLKALNVTVPPLPEQCTIAEALSDVDALLAGLDRLIAKKRDLKQAAMQQLVTGQTRLPGFQGGWLTLPAREVGLFKGGAGFPLSAQGEASGDYPFFKVSDMNNFGNETFMTTANHYVSEQTRKKLCAMLFPAGSIVFAKVGAAVFLERKKILGQASCIDNNMAAFIIDESRAHVGYVHMLLLSMKLGALVSTTALPSLNGKQLGEIPLAIPPLTEQVAIATVLSDMDAELTALEARRDKTRALKQGMMQELLTGRIRLVKSRS